MMKIALVLALALVLVRLDEKERLDDREPSLEVSTTESTDSLFFVCPLDAISAPNTLVPAVVCDGGCECECRGRIVHSCVVRRFLN